MADTLIDLQKRYNGLIKKWDKAETWDKSCNDIDKKLEFLPQVTELHHNICSTLHEIKQLGYTCDLKEILEGFTLKED